MAGKKTQVTKKTTTDWLGYFNMCLRPCRRFVRRIIQSQEQEPPCVVQPEDYIWWYKFLEQWNGIGLLPDMENRTIKLYSDASGS